MKKRTLLLSVAMIATVCAAPAQEVELLSLSRNGLLSWTNSTLNATCRVEWAPSVEGPWHSSWGSLTNIAMTNHVMQREVPMFFRVVCAPPPPILTQVPSEEALTLLVDRHNDTGFVVLDVRTPGEYAPRHIRAALNIDFRSATFEAEVSQLDRRKAYLVYCASGVRSGQAVVAMQRLEFLEVYNLLGGFGGFVSTTGADDWLEP